MSLVLTGSFDTSELPRLGVDPVTVTVSRDVAPGHEADFEAWASDVQKALHKYPGCLGVGVLKAGTVGGRYHIVFRFTDLVALRRWERSPERTALLARLDEHVVATSVRRTVPGGGGGSATIAWVTPMALVITFIVSPHLAFIPVVPRVVLTTIATTAIVGFGIMPLRGLRARRRPGLTLSTGLSASGPLVSSFLRTGL
jgi:hypothetical protein